MCGAVGPMFCTLRTKSPSDIHERAGESILELNGEPMHVANKLRIPWLVNRRDTTIYRANNMLNSRCLDYTYTKMEELNKNGTMVISL